MIHFLEHLGQGILGTVIFLILDILSQLKRFDKNKDGMLDWSEIKEYLWFNSLQLIGISAIALILAIPWTFSGGDGILTPLGKALNMGEYAEMIYFGPGFLWMIVQLRFRRKYREHKNE